MSDCILYTLVPCCGVRISKAGLAATYDWSPRIGFLRGSICVDSSRLEFDRSNSRQNGGELLTLKWMNCTKASRNASFLGYEEDEDYDELDFKERGEKGFDLEASPSEAELENSTKQNGVDTNSKIKEDGRGDDVFDFWNLKGGLEDVRRSRKSSRRGLKDDNLVKIDDKNGVDYKMEESLQHNGRPGLRGRRQTVTRSSMLAKQVISIQSALSLGFVSQLWVDTSSWMVLVVEVRPNLLSGESERFLLEDVTKVGDVVLVQDESLMESGFRMVGLEILVGYNVVTPGRRSIGKVRSYTFNINSGAVESLELDCFGISIIPSTLVSTYALFVEDVLEVVRDTVVVHEAAASRIQRLTKGFWGTQNVETSTDEIGEYHDLERQSVQYDLSQRSRRSSRRRKSSPKIRDIEEDWELPMDYL